MIFGYSLLPPEQVNRLKRVSITYNAHQIILWLCYYCFADPLELQYTLEGDGTTVECKKKGLRTMIRNMDFTGVFCQDLRDILAFQKSVIQEFKIGISGFEDGLVEPKTEQAGAQIIEFLGSHLKNDLQVKNISLDVTTSNQFLKILPIFNPRVLENVDLTLKTNGVATNIGDLLGPNGLEGRNDLELGITVGIVTLEDLNGIKEIFQSNKSNFKNIEIFYTGLLPDHLYHLFGPPQTIQEQHDVTNRSLLITNTQSWNISHFESFKLLKFVRDDSVRPIEPELVVRPPEDRRTLMTRVFQNHVVMRKILDYLNGIDLQSPRKVSHDIREIIDFLKPDPHIETIEVELKDTIPKTIHVNYNNYKDIDYENCLGDCVVNDIYIQKDHQNAFLDDYEDIMKNQSDPLKVARLNFSNDLEILEKFKNQQLIRTEKVELAVINQSETIEIMGLVDPDHLRTIEIKSSTNNYLQGTLEINELGAMAQWKRAKELIINTLVTSTPVPEINFENLENVDILVDSMSPEDLTNLKQKFFTSRHLLRFKISFNTFFDDNNTNEPWEDLDLNNSSTSYYRIKGAGGQVLSIAYSMQNRTFIFARLKSEEIPGNAVVHN